MYSHVPRHQEFLLFSKSTDQWLWAPSQLCTAFTHDLYAHSNLKLLVLCRDIPKQGEYTAQRNEWGTLKIPYYDNATGSKVSTDGGWFSPKEEFGESRSNVLSCQMTIVSYWRKQMKEFQEKKIKSVKIPEKTWKSSLTIKSKHKKAWKNAEMIATIWSRRKQRKMKKDEEEPYHTIATLIY